MFVFTLSSLRRISALAAFSVLCLLARGDSWTHPLFYAPPLAAETPVRPLPAPRAVAEKPARLQPTPARAAAAAARLSCERKIRDARATPASPGTPELDAVRARLFTYAKAEPVLFVRRPLPTAKASKNAVVYRALLERTSSPWSVLKRLWPALSARPDLGRSVLLREGYLYAEKPHLAFSMVDLVSAQMLFSDDRIWVQRGERLLFAERTRSGEYVFSGGEEDGNTVRLMLFDRVGTGEPPPPIHRGLRAVRQRLGFDRMKIVHITENAVVADLRYGSAWVTTLLRAEGPSLRLECELVPEQQADEVEAARADHDRRLRVLEPLRRAMAAQVEDGLPFDEPRTEYGQQDGALRPRWRDAYETGRTWFDFQDDRYYVFNARGKPLVPQVCIDFIFDTFARASGSWWRDRGEPRERRGKIPDFGASGEDLRRTTSLVELATRQPEDFDLYTIPDAERIAFKRGKQLSEYLQREADRFVPGDVVMIRGYVPWQKPWLPLEMHVHSFFIYESDPLTGIPIALAGNPGRPLLQTWQFEAFRTPERFLWYRIRPHLDWLEQLLQPLPSGAKLPAPPPLSVESKR